MSVARFYRADKNESGASFPGVPLADISEEEWARLPAWLQNSVDASESYQKTNPAAAHRKRTDDTEKET